MYDFDLYQTFFLCIYKDNIVVPYSKQCINSRQIKILMTVQKIYNSHYMIKHIFKSNNPVLRTNKIIQYNNHTIYLYHGFLSMKQNKYYYKKHENVSIINKNIAIIM